VLFTGLIGAEASKADEGNANDDGVGTWSNAVAEEVTVEQVIQGHRQLIERARAKGLKIFGGTLTPVEGFLLPGTPFPVLHAREGGQAPGTQCVDSHQRRI
jgi:hypothetical protein